MTRTKMKHAAYALLALALFIYGVPRIELTEGWTLQNVFGALWLAFALLVCAAHLHRLFLVDEATEARLGRVKREKYAAWERRLHEKRFDR